MKIVAAGHHSRTTMQHCLIAGK